MCSDFSRKKKVTFSAHNTVAYVCDKGITGSFEISADAMPLTQGEMKQKASEKLRKQQEEVARAAAQLVGLWLQENPKAKKALLAFLYREPAILLFPWKLVNVFFFDGYYRKIKDFINSAVNENRDLYLPNFKGVKDCERSLLTEFFGALVLHAKRTSPYYEPAVVRVQALVRGWLVRRRLEQDKWEQVFDRSQGL